MEGRPIEAGMEGSGQVARPEWKGCCLRFRFRGETVTAASVAYSVTGVPLIERLIKAVLCVEGGRGGWGFLPKGVGRGGEGREKETRLS